MLQRCVRQFKYYSTWNLLCWKNVFNFSFIEYIYVETCNIFLCTDGSSQHGSEEEEFWLDGFHLFHSLFVSPTGRRNVKQIISCVTPVEILRFKYFDHI